MIRFQVDTDSILRNLMDGGEAVMAPGLFGGISINRSPTESAAFDQSIETFGLTHIRWPGGTLSETAVVTPESTVRITYDPALPRAYDLGYPDLLHPDALTRPDGTPTGRTGFAEALQTAIAQDMSMSVILPTLRYLDDPAQARADTMAFLNALFVEGRWNGGQLPEPLILDVGNENYEPEGYARVSVEILRAIADFRAAHPDAAFDVAFQAMQSDEDTRALIDWIDRFSGPGETALLAEVDHVRMHNLCLGLEGVRNIEVGKKADALMTLRDAILDDRAERGTDGKADIGVYFSAWTVSANDVDRDMLLPMASATAMLSLFTGMAELGTDLAAAWGVGMESFAHSVTMSWQDPETGALHLSPHGAVFRQMAEVLPGMKPIAHPDLDQGRASPMNLYAFSDDRKVVIFLAAGDLPGRKMPVTVDLADFGRIASVEAESVSADGGVAGRPVIGTPDVTVTGSSLSVDLTADYQVVRIVVMRAEPGGPSLPPGAEPNRLVGTDGIDTLSFADAADRAMVDLATGTAEVGGEAVLLAGFENVRGTAFADTIAGDAGANRIQGLAGHDLMAGSAGHDTYFGGAGRDTVAYDGAIAGVTASLMSGTGSGGQANGDRYVGIENLTGSNFRDRLAGDDRANALTGLGGDDFIFGNAGDDTIHGGGGDDLIGGGNGDDVLAGGAGNDIINTSNGGAGWDTAVFSGAQSAYTIATLADGRTTVLHNDGGVDGFDTLSGVEVLQFSDGLIYL